MGLLKPTQLSQKTQQIKVTQANQPTPIMDISFVLLTWNSEKYISKCFDSLFADVNNSRFSYEIFVVDNGSQDNTPPIIRSFKEKYPEHIIPIYLAKNTGTTYSRNLALKRAKGEYIVIMDSDIEVCEGTIEELVKALSENENVGLVAPKLVYPDNSLQKSTDVFPTICTKIFRYFFLKVIEKRDSRFPEAEGLCEVDYAISAMWALKREVLERVGLLDENIFYSPEDVDYCLRMWKAGCRVLYDPGIRCVHHTQELSRGLRINTATLNHIRGLVYYFTKHQYVVNRPKHNEMKTLRE